MLLTFAECKDPNAGITDIAGNCATGIKFAALINQSVRRIIQRGDFPGSIMPLHLCVYNGCVAMPRYVQTIRRVNRCNESVPVKSIWYQFLDMHLYHGSNRYGLAPWVGHECGLQQQERTPVFSDVRGDGRLIRAYARNPLDLGKTVTIYGQDNYGQDLITKNLDGTWTPGVVITLAAPYGSTSVYVRHIDRVLKDKTQGVVDVYAYDAANNVLEDIAHYDPGETNPSYAKYSVQLPNQFGTGSSCCGAPRGIVALVKLAFIPVVDDTDLIPLEQDCLSAIKFMVQSIRFAESGDRASAQGYLADTIAELNRVLENAIPDEQIPVAINPFGETCIGSQKVF